MDIRLIFVASPLTDSVVVSQAIQLVESASCGWSQPTLPAHLMHHTRSLLIFLLSSPKTSYEVICGGTVRAAVHLQWLPHHSEFESAEDGGEVQSECKETDKLLCC